MASSFQQEPLSLAAYLYSSLLSLQKPLLNQVIEFKTNLMRENVPGGSSVAEIITILPQAILKTKLKINMQAHSKLKSIFRNSGTKAQQSL